MACSQVENNSIMIDEILNTRKTCTKYQVVKFCPPFLDSMSTFFSMDAPFCLTSVFEDLLIKLYRCLQTVLAGAWDSPGH